MFRTGDIQKNIEKLRIELHQIKYPDKPDSEILRSGNPEIFLPIIHYTLFNYSKYVANYLSQNNYNMFAKCDLDFINSAFKALIKLFDYKPSLSTKQFFSEGFAEAKVLLCSDIINIVKSKHSTLCKKAFSHLPPAKPKANSASSTLKKNTPMLPLPKQPELSSTIQKDDNYSPRFNQNEVIHEDDTQYEEVPQPEEMYNPPIVNDNNLDDYAVHLDNNDNIEVYESSQEFNIPKQDENPSSIPVTNNSISSIKYAQMQMNNLQSSHPSSVGGATGSGIDFGTLVQVISSLSSSVTQMANKIEKFKVNIEDRMNKVEAEIALIKNRQNIIENKISNPTPQMNESNNEQIFSFACDEMNTNRENNNVENISNTFSNTVQLKDNNEDMMNSSNNNVYNNSYSYGANRINTMNPPAKYKETDQLIENVEKKFRETKKLLSQFN